jgi:hypothetical protein
LKETVQSKKIKKQNDKQRSTKHYTENSTLLVLYRIHLAWVGFELTTLVVIDTNCIGGHKSNYHTITTTRAPIFSNSSTKWQTKIYKTLYRKLNIAFVQCLPDILSNANQNTQSEYLLNRTAITNQNTQSEYLLNRTAITNQNTQSKYLLNRTAILFNRYLDWVFWFVIAVLFNRYLDWVFWFVIAVLFNRFSDWVFWFVIAVLFNRFSDWVFWFVIAVLFNRYSDWVFWFALLNISGKHWTKVILSFLYSVL